MLLLPSSSSFSYSKLYSTVKFHGPTYPDTVGFLYTRNRICCAKRTGKQRYPSEKKKLKSKHKELLSDSKDKDKFEGTWRLFKLAVPLDQDPGKDFLDISDGLLQEIAKVLKFPVASMLPREAFSVVRKSFDARKPRV